MGHAMTNQKGVLTQTGIEKGPYSMGFSMSGFLVFRGMCYVNRAGTRFPDALNGVVYDCNKAILLNPNN